MTGARVTELRHANKLLKELLSKLPKAASASSDLHRAQSLLQEALEVAEKTLKGADGDLVREALGLRDEASKAAQAIQDECARLEHQNDAILQECESLEEERTRREEYIGTVDSAAAEHQADLDAKFADLRLKNAALHDHHEQLVKELVTSSGVGHDTDIKLGRLKRRHQDALAENAWAKEVLSLERSVDNYKRTRQGQCKEVQEMLAKAHYDSHERMAKLLEQWEVQKKKYNTDMEEIQAKLSDLQSKYDQRWRIAEHELDQKIAFTYRTAAEVEDTVEHHIGELDKEREHEAIALQNQIQYQKDRLMSAVTTAKEEMEDSYQRVQRQCQDKLDGEHAKCEDQRAVHRSRVRESEREVERWKRHIGKVREAYHQQERALPTPRANTMSPVQVALMN
jgi:hypothetical protein